MRGCNAVAGKKGAVKGFLTFKSGFLPDFGNCMVGRAKLMGCVIKPKMVDISRKAAVQFLGENPGDIIFIKMQFLSNFIQCQRFLKMIGDIGDKAVADFCVAAAVSGKQFSFLEKICQNR